MEESVSLFQEAVSKKDSVAMRDIALQRNACRKMLEECIQLHRLIPSGVGSGAAKVEQKVSALCVKLFTETQSFPNLQRLLQSVVGFCTDSGTELAVADVGGCLLRDVLPEWFHDPLLAGGGADAADGLGCDFDMNIGASDAACLGNTQDGAGQEYVFPAAIVSPGNLHICHSMTSEVDGALEHYSEWLPQFRAVVRLLHHDHLRNRFLGTCVLNGRFDWMKPQARDLKNC